MLEYFNIGLITNYHGLKGYVKVMGLTDDIARYKDLKYVFIDKHGIVKVDIEDVKFQKNFVLLKLKGIDDINEAEKYKNLYIKVDRTNAVKLPEGSYFVCDLIGCEVFDHIEGLLGKIEEIIQTGSNDVYVVKNSEGNERLIPVIKDVVKNIDIEKKRIDVILMEGL